MPPAGAKLFYLSGMKNGRYMKREVLNLARFISVMKFRPLSWRQTHPFLLADRFEVGVCLLLLKCGSQGLQCLLGVSEQVPGPPLPAGTPYVDGNGLAATETSHVGMRSLSWCLHPSSCWQII